MGIDISPGGASWSYGGFARFRERLAEAEGIDLNAMRGFGGSKEWDESSSLQRLLHHSDCDGYLDSWECDEVIPRLTEILDSWDANDLAHAYDLEQGRRLLAGMVHSVEHGCSVSFH